MAALLFLSASPARVDRADAKEFARLSGPLVFVSALWGLITIWLWQLLLALTWQRLLNLVVPAAVTAGVTGLVFYRQATLSLLATPILGKRLPRWARIPSLLILTVGVGFMFNYGVRYWDSDQINNLPASLQWLWPEPLYRVMFLSNLWGAWAILVLVQFHRGSVVSPAIQCDANATDHATPPDAEPATREFAATAHPLWAGLFLVVPLALSLVHLGFLHPRHFVPPLAAVVAALGLGSLLIRLHGGLCRKALLAANFVTQGVFWLAYLSVMR